MATLIIRKLDDRTKTNLKVQAARHGRSMEEEAREILRLAVSNSRSVNRNLAAGIRELFADVGGVELELPPRDPPRTPPRFSK